ncbi:hypothetical protein [Pedobacter metabolipauper]|uniref:Uncharacterized protein n=1 Tax=Pedobacter metabolipauper TaxID=425513 RepID=A0A4R6SXY2_9SPHI|nr:hypothetical protein [Pedobacter metabolipauper]TDQ09534.1 hypothetical protein ATK78_1690 [Pedobacter metabolipauper]
MQKLIIIESGIKKYKINECMLRLSRGDYKKAVLHIPGFLNISLNTFHNWRKISINDEQDIPHEKVVLFEILFGLKRGGLLNKRIRSKSLNQRLKAVTQ